MTKEDKESYNALKEKLRAMQEAKKKEIVEEKETSEEEEEAEEIDEEPKEQVAKQEKSGLSRQEIEDMIEGHLIRATRLFQIYIGKE
jgi:DNA-binding transcriptional regulator YhcF (GntR family)